MIDLIIFIITSLFFIVIIFFYSSNLYHLVVRRRPPLISSNKKVYNLVVSDLNLFKTKKIIEIGSGRGFGLNIFAKNKNIDVIGYEVAIFPYLYSKILNRKNSNVKILKTNIFKIKSFDADVIYLYMYDNFNKQIEPILISVCKKGTFVYSYAFKFSNLTPLKVIKVNKALHDKLFLYQI